VLKFASGGCSKLQELIARRCALAQHAVGPRAGSQIWPSDAITMLALPGNGGSHKLKTKLPRKKRFHNRLMVYGTHGFRTGIISHSIALSRCSSYIHHALRTRSSHLPCSPLAYSLCHTSKSRLPDVCTLPAIARHPHAIRYTVEVCRSKRSSRNPDAPWRRHENLGCSHGPNWA
jgi:hypothetical protein